MPQKLLLEALKKSSLESGDGSISLHGIRRVFSVSCADLMTLLVHLRVLAVRRLGVMCHALGKAGAVCAILRSSRCARCCRLVPDGWELRVRGLLARYTNGLAHLSVDRSLRRTTVVCHTLLLSVLVHLSALTFVVGLTLGFLFLLLCLPFFANFLKLFWCSLLAMRLHCNMRVKMVQGTISFFAAVPTTLVHTLNFFVTPARSLVLLRAWNGYK